MILRGTDLQSGTYARPDRVALGEDSVSLCPLAYTEPYRRQCRADDHPGQPTKDKAGFREHRWKISDLVIAPGCRKGFGQPVRDRET